jgi:predicted enzyme related to lactoylglutathione lyase
MKNQSPFIWHELVTPDQTRSGAFFSQLFGWTLKEVDAGPFGTYTLFQRNGQDVSNTRYTGQRAVLECISI